MTDSPTRVHTCFDSPVGELTVVSDGTHVVGIYMAEHRHRPDLVTFGPRDDAAEPFAAAREQLDEYFAGTRRTFDLPLAPVGTEFQHRVWAALTHIPYGETWSYGRLAAEIGNPGAARAVGLANGRNPISIVVPCHRVVGADGSLTGYAGGADRKRLLLDLERRSASAGN